MNDTTAIAALRAALEADHSQLPWFKQFGDDVKFMCCTAISTSNNRTHNDGQFSAVECNDLVALTLHQCYPFVQADCERDDANTELILSACNAAPELLAELDRLRAENERMRAQLEPNPKTADFDALILELADELKAQAAEKAASDAAHIAAGRCPECEGEGQQGGQFCGGYWTCELCGGSGRAQLEQPR